MWVLIIFLIHGDVAVSQHDYSSRQTCGVALAAAKTLSMYAYALCVPK